ncbi:MAG: hypothetical protein IK077_05200 [Thermoguttaceae bacterium]|nr:hypothetical protein [Thermoguttaceae bacterium]
MSLFSLISFGGKKNNISSKRVESRKLRLEALEDRQLLDAAAAAQLIEDSNQVLIVNTLEDVVDGNYDVLSLREAIEAVNTVGAEDVIIRFNVSGVTTESPGTITVNSALTIKSPVTIQGGNKIILDGGYRYSINEETGESTLQNTGDRIFDIRSTAGDVKLEKITLQNGHKGDQNGGAIYITSGNGGVPTLTLDYVTLQNNHAVGAGAILVKGANLIVDHSVFYNNSTNYHDNKGVAKLGPEAGALKAEESNYATANVIVRNTTFSENLSMYGGALLADSAEVTITNVIFDGNVASGTDKTKNSGGAVYSIDTKLNVSDSQFTGNVSNFTGGAIYFTGAEKVCSITNVNFDSNIAIGDKNSENNGGAIYFAEGTIGNINDSVFIGNTSHAYGGAVFVNGASVTSNNSNYTGNGAELAYGNKNYKTSNGGAVYVAGGTFTVNGGTFDGNVATENGGAINAAAGALTLNNGTFVNNGKTTSAEVKTKLGGAIYVAGGTVEANSGVYTANAATDDGGAVFVLNGTFSDVKGKFTQNVADRNGGAIYNSGTFTEVNGEFLSNSAASGGAVYNKDTVDVSTSSFSGNTATNGGAIYNVATSSDSSTTLTNVALTGNVATENGGAIYVESGTVSSKGGSSYANNGKEDGEITTVNGGAVYVANGTFSDEGSSFTINAATKYGGAVYVSNGAFASVDGKFEGNKATRGGAIANFSLNGTGVSFNGTTSFINNVATPLAGSNGSFGGAIYNVGAISMSVENGTTAFIGNKATDESGDPVVNESGLNGYSGGAIYNSTKGSKTGSITAKNVAFENNFAGKYGGAVSNFGTFNATNATFANNVASAGGAVQTSGTATFAGSTFTSNAALKSAYTLDGGTDFGGNGGAIFASGARKSVSISGTTTFTGNQAANAGGAIDYINGSLSFGSSDLVKFENNVARTVGGAIVAAGKIDFADGLSASSFNFTGNKATTIDVSGVDGTFHRGAENTQESSVTGFYAPTVAIACDVADQDIATIAETFFADPYVEENVYDRSLVDAFVSYKVAAYNKLSYADLASSFETDPNRILVEVTKGETVETSTLSRGGSLNLDAGYNVVRYCDGAYSSVNDADVYFRANIYVGSDSTSVSVSKINVEGIDLGGGDLPVGVTIQVRSDSNKPIAKWTLDWGDGTVNEIANYGFTCNAYHVYGKGTEATTYSLTISTTDEKNVTTTYDGVAAEFHVPKAESSDSTDGSGSVLDADFFSDLELVDELFED